MTEQRPDWEHAERRALVADLIRTQATLQARSEQLRGIFASRWYRLARFTWRLRRGRIFRKTAPSRLAGEGSFARPLNGDAVAAAEPEVWLNAGPPGEAPVDSDAPREPASEPVPGLDRRGPRDEGSPAGAKRLLIAGHSVSFSDWIGQQAGRAGAIVRQDPWRTHGAHEEDASAAALAWADVVFCEWCLGNAVWYSRNKQPGQRLVVRFHRMEMDTAYPGEVDLDRVDAMVFVAQHVLDGACRRFGWDPDDPKLRVVPNGVDLAALHREKPAGAEFTLATIGYVPRLKRLDRAFDVLELLRAHDDRYRLLVKGREPWEHGWMSARSGERGFYEDLRRRLEMSPGLREAVSFEPFGDDVPAFLQRAGWVLSTSEIEGHSVAVAEGMASGAAPVVFDRPGAADQYERHWVHADAAAAARAILDVEERGEATAEGESARHFAERWSTERLAPAWASLLLSDDAQATARNAA